MTHDEAKAALDEIYRRTGYGANLTPVFRKMPNPGVWRVTYTIAECNFRAEAMEAEQAITSALSHVRKETVIEK